MVAVGGRARGVGATHAADPIKCDFLDCVLWLLTGIHPSARSQLQLPGALWLIATIAQSQCAPNNKKA